ncbi:MAG: hypothetical protein QME96_06500, partial [Myxococcota bacterium]|nr:hypothetical protein [Myxococcota bacterium]
MSVAPDTSGAAARHPQPWGLGVPAQLVSSRHTSSSVRSFPSSHGTPGVAVVAHPLVAGLQESAVHGLPSSQSASLRHRQSTSSSVNPSQSSSM